ncbi:MAG TPA: CDP-glucose 4,6-dehydratase [Niabella sp.]|nr:CDP-glucose 4,6-dehydratase [Niabella sp.]HOZ97347.1 CDP-glucose 4,6-dehydratase [Niabella sp.]HQW15382.1 CDP-glucose 4,6-dehydratase [Niabella sp.]HQX20572.1 CDP-glucose 4,6-dehydratase [Niabella sp.]HQX40957.1 CDP-glucose 4,6-dehydratase [Niabella sp.]
MFADIYRGKKVIITGHTGFKGSWLSLWLLQLGARVYGVSDEVPTKPSLFETLKLKDLLTDHRLDIRDREGVRQLIETIQPDFVFHLAAQPIVSVSYQDPVGTFATNVMGTAHILDALRGLKGNCTCVVISSDKCYENEEWVWGYKETDKLGGKDIYSASKGATEIVFKSYYHSFFKNSANIRLVSARAGNVIGGGDWAVDRIIPDCMRAWSQNQPVEIRSPKATRPWQHVLEPLSGYLLLGQLATQDFSLHGESFNFGPTMDSNYSVLSLLKDISSKWSYNNDIEPYILTGNQPFHEAGLLKVNCEKALFYLKWLPVLTYKELIEMTSDWYYKFYHGEDDLYQFTLTQLELFQSLAKEKKLEWAI